MTDTITITIPRSAVEQALAALKYEKDANNPLDWHHDRIMDSLRAALEQPQVEQEPVAWIHKETRLLRLDGRKGGDFDDKHWQPLYTRPQPPRQPLTDEQIDAVYGDTVGYSYIEFARAIERAHGIGGNA